MMWNMPFESGWAYGSWFGPFHFVIPLLFWGLIIAAVIYVVARVIHRREDLSPAGHRRSSLEILEQRYARGEIEREEFLKKKADIARS